MYYRIFALVTIKALVIADVFYYILVFLYLQSTYSCLSAMDDGVPIGRNNYWQLRKIYRVLKDDRVLKEDTKLSLLWQLNFCFSIYKTMLFIRIKIYYNLQKYTSITFLIQVYCNKISYCVFR